MAGSFVLDLKRFEEKVGGDAGLMRQVVRKITLELFSRCIMKSPVDTGRFRANWGVMVGRPDSYSNPMMMDKSGAATVGKAAAGVLNWNATGNIFLTNNLPYSIPLEYGHSQQQAPGGMVRASIAEIQEFANNVRP